MQALTWFKENRIDAAQARLLDTLTKRWPEQSAFGLTDLATISEADCQHCLSVPKAILKPIELKRFERVFKALVEASFPGRPDCAFKELKKSTGIEDESDTVKRPHDGVDETEEWFEIAKDVYGLGLLEEREKAMTLLDLRAQEQDAQKALAAINEVLCRQVMGVRKQRTEKIEAGDVTAFTRTRLEQSKQGHVEHLRRLKALIRAKQSEQQSAGSVEPAAGSQVGSRSASVVVARTGKSNRVGRMEIDHYRRNTPVEILVSAPVVSSEEAAQIALDELHKGGCEGFHMSSRF